MVGVSRRYAFHIALLSLLFAVPTLLHWSGRFEARDCRNPEAVYPATAKRAPLGEAEERLDRGRTAGEERVGDLRLDFVVNRSFHPRRVYHKPGRGLVTGGQALTTEVEYMQDGEHQLPIHWIRIEQGVSRESSAAVAGYLLFYDGEAVANPLLAQLLSAPKQMVRGRLPMTLYLVHTRVRESEVASARAAVRDWLRGAARTYEAACHDG